MRQFTIEDLHRLLFNQAAFPAELDPWKDRDHTIHGRLQLNVGPEVENRIVKAVLGALTYRSREQIRRLITRMAEWPASDDRTLDLLVYWSRIGEKYFDYLESFYIKPTLFEMWRRQMHASDEDLPALAWLVTTRCSDDSTLSPALFDQWPTFMRGNDPQLYRELKKGFGCLHLHLSGAYPAPFFWVGLMNSRFDEQDMLPTAEDERRLRGYHTKDEIVTLVALVKMARSIRCLLYRFVEGRTSHAALFNERGPCEFLNSQPPKLLQPGPNQTDYAQADVSHWEAAVCPSLIGERFLLLRILAAIRKIDDDGLAERLSRLLWAYLVAKQRFLGTVQQAEGIAGFDYFEHTFRLVRWRKGGTDLSQCGVEIGNFLQESGGLVKLELMIAPQKTASDYGQDVSLVKVIEERLKKRQAASTRAQCGEPRVGMVIHFLKDLGEPLRDRLSQTDKGDGLLAYHHGVRDRIVCQFQELKGYLEGADRIVCGIDAANRELYCPPEVFAEVFRRTVLELRRRDSSRSFPLGRTFHVGEDFVHLATGLRRIYEALVFLELRPGDRLGHACALGIDPSRWCSMTQSVEMHLIDILDDAVFEAVLLRSQPGTGSTNEHRMSALERTIDELSVKIFGTTVPLVQLEQAWRMRATASRNGQEIFGHQDSIPSWIRIFHQKYPPRPEDQYTAQYMDAGSHGLASDLQPLMPPEVPFPRDVAKRVAAEYLHDLRTVRRFLHMQTVATIDSAEHLARLQSLVADELNARGVVIESNPSSNWLIGGYESHLEIPAVRWLLSHGEDHGRIPFTINPDDPTVFASSLENEYFMVFAAAVHSARQLTRAQCLREISVIRERSLQASFLD